MARAAMAALPPATGAETALPELPPRSYYDIILSRKPFGDPPPTPVGPVDPAAAAADQAAAQQAKEEEKLAKQIHMVAVNKTPAGNTAVGFIDKSEKPERSYYINVGETVNGYTVVDASFEDETATLSKGEVTISLKLGEGLIRAAAEPPPVAMRGGRGIPPRAMPPVAVRTAPPPQAAAAQPPPTSRPDLSSESFRQRLARQRAEREAAESATRERNLLEAQAVAEKITQEELDKKTREINLNLIRQGMKPISTITLTPEEDAALVEQGVLQE